MKNKKLIKKTGLSLLFILCQFCLLMQQGLSSIAEEGNAITAKEGESSVIEDENISGESTGTDDSSSKTEVIKATELDLGDYSVTMTIGEKQLLTITVLPLDTTDQTIKFSTSNKDVATVNGLGRIMALSVGTTRISVSCGKAKEKFTLTVKEKEEEQVDTEVPVTDVEVADYEEELEVGKTVSFSTTIIPSDATDTKVSYTSGNPEVATVSSTGEVKGISAGHVTIIITAGSISKNIELTVKVATTAIRLNSAYVVLKEGDTFGLKAEVLPQNATQSLSFKSMDTGTATITGDGTITAVKTGSTTVIVSNGDLSNAVTVIVNKETTAEDAQGEDQKEEDSNPEHTKGEAALIQKIMGQDTVTIEVVDYGVITKPVLKALYESGSTLRISSYNYVITLSGKDIVNYENELYTGIKFSEEGDGSVFELNKGKNLPGALTVSITGGYTYKYVYLYNVSKNKYEQLKGSDLLNLRMDMAGTYMLTEKQLKNRFMGILVLAVGAIIVAGLAAGYIVVGKRYLFW